MAVEIIDANTKGKNDKKNMPDYKNLFSFILPLMSFGFSVISAVLLHVPQMYLSRVKSHLETNKAFIPKNNIQLISALCLYGKWNESK